MAVLEADIELEEAAAPRFYEPLEDDEACLYAIMTDESGIDPAEFLWTDERNPDGCWRAWPFQWMWWRHRAMKQIDQAGRSIGKTESIIARCCVFPFIHPRQEMVLTAPQGIHLDALTERIEATFNNVRILDEMTLGGRGGVKHRPFLISFINGAHIMGRIPQLSGAGVKGTHPVWLEQDEAQDYPEKGWKEIIETLDRRVEGAEWRVHGVPRGIPDKFQEYINSDDWAHNRYTAVHKPSWSDEERQQKIAEYGTSEDDPEYRRNVYGELGDSTNRIFVLERFMRCTDSVEASAYNNEEYFLRKISAENVERLARDAGELVEGATDEHTAAMMTLLDFPVAHTSNYQTFWCGMDVGLTSDPSEILVFAEYRPSTKELKLDAAEFRAVPKDGVTRLKLLTRIQLQRIPDPLQEEVIMAVVDFYKPKAFSLDKTGIGANLLQGLQSRALKSRFQVIPDAEKIDQERVDDARKTLTAIKGYGYSEKIVVEINEAEAERLPPGLSLQEIAEKAGIKRNVKEYATDKLRELVDTQRLLLPWDKDLINQWNGQTWQFSNAGTDAYGNRAKSYSQGIFHTLDAGRMAALGYFQAPIEAMLLAPPERRRPVLAQFLS
jgi:hypothetical protein